MERKFKEMLDMQVETNNLLIPEGWKHLSYRDAIWTKCAELMEHIGWKWWKKQELNLEQARLEIVDIWHFGMSLDLCEYDTDKLASYYDSRAHHLEGSIDKDRYALIRGIACDATQGNYFRVTSFFQLMNSLGMTLDELYTGYMGKNVLNRFRKANGYKEGTYIKNWLGEEDNEYLARLLPFLLLDSASFVEEMEATLAVRYKEVLEVGIY